MKLAFYLMTLVAAGTLCAAEPTYTCSMKLGNPKFESHVSETGKDNGNNNWRRRNRKQVETLRRKMICPVTVAFRGKEFPADVKLKYIFLGQTNGKTTIMQSQTQPVALNEKGDFTIDLVSPEAVLVTTKRRTSRRSTSETKGSRISGCIVQLYVGEKMVRYGTTKPAWASVAKKASPPDEELLKLR